MRYGEREFTEIKRLLWKYNLGFDSHQDYEKFIKELAAILSV